MSIVLASASPRRQELLSQLGLSFSVLAPNIDESRLDACSPGSLVETLSREKALHVAKECTPQDCIIAADTVVVLDGQILGKPSTEEDAVQMLHALSGRTHKVFTGLTVLQNKRAVTTHEMTTVHIRPLSDQIIRQYIGTGEPTDKAGAYGIQGYGALLVSGIQGDYFNVVGLPLGRLSEALSSFGIDILALASKA